MLLKYHEYIKEGSIYSVHNKSEKVLIGITQNITREELKKYITGSISKIKHNTEIGELWLNTDTQLALSRIMDVDLRDLVVTDIDNVMDKSWTFITRERIKSNNNETLRRIAHLIIGFEETSKRREHPKFEIIKELVRDIEEESPIVVNTSSIKREYTGGSPYRVSYIINIEHGISRGEELETYLNKFKPELSVNGLEIYNIFPVYNDGKTYLRMEIMEISY